MKKKDHSKCAPQISKIHELSLMSTTSFQGIARSQISSNKIKSIAFGSVQHLLQPHMHGCCQWPNYPKPTPLLHCWKYYRHCCPCLSTEGFRTKIFFSQEIRFAVIPVSERCDPIAQADASSARLLEILSSLLSLSEHSVEGHQGMIQHTSELLTCICHILGQHCDHHPPIQHLMSPKWRTKGVQ